MSFTYSLDTLKRVSQIETAKDILQLSNAQFPGTHCPLFGVALTAGYIKDMVVLIVGTDECTYYTKTFNLNRRNSDPAMQDNFLSFAINQSDVVFGCASKVEEVVRQIDREYRPKAIMIVTTCVLEVIGEDFEAFVTSIGDEIDARLLVVRTEHFKCNSHIPGIERTLTALTGLMRKQEPMPNTVNILGHRYAGIYETELLKLLIAKGVAVNIAIPSSSSVAQIAEAPKAALNIVTDFAALPLAKAMQEKFATPYVYFDKFLEPSRIARGYKELGHHLGLDLSAEVSAMHNTLKAVMAEIKPELSGKRFVYGNTPMLAFEFSSFLASLGMEPVLIQARDLYANDDIYMKEILEHGFDPYVSRIANIAPLQSLYGTLAPHVYIGHEDPERLRKLGIAQVALDQAAAKLGFDVPITVLKALQKTLGSAQSQDRRPMHHAAV